MSVQSLVEAAQQPAVDVAGLWDTYKGMVSRSLDESQRLRQELEAMGDGALIDAFSMFYLPEAYGPDRYPLVGMAPIAMPEIEFHHEFTRTDFRGRKSTNPLLSIASPPERQLTEADLRNPFMSMSSYNGHSGIVAVPLVPKAIAPRFWSAKRLLGKCWIMFDTPTWTDKRVLPVDPYLLERVDEKRFRVLAHWDLSAKERQLMALIR